MSPFSDYIIYLDESGDHSLDVIDPQFPIFVLSACAFRKSDYSVAIVPHFLDLKFRFFGHDMVVLHSAQQATPAQNRPVLDTGSGPAAGDGHSGGRSGLQSGTPF